MGGLTYAKTVSAPLYKQIYSFVWSFFLLFLVENPLVTRQYYRWIDKNPQSEITGPLYVFGAPDRTMEPGKGVVADVQELKDNAPFVLKLRLRSPSGKPLSHAKVDIWLANSWGQYSYRSYYLRGKFQADEKGVVEILAVCPGLYGNGRPGHFHMFINPGPEDIKYVKPFTTQVYVCASNDEKWLRTASSGFAGLFGRENATSLVCQCYNLGYLPLDTRLLSSTSTPTKSGSTRFMDFPLLDEKIAENLTSGEKERFTALKRSADWWESRLKADGLGLCAIGEISLTLSSR